MKSWQDRGEVLDSDDEEAFYLGPASQSSEQAQGDLRPRNERESSDGARETPGIRIGWQLSQNRVQHEQHGSSTIGLQHVSQSEVQRSSPAVSLFSAYYATTGGSLDTSAAFKANHIAQNSIVLPAVESTLKPYQSSPRASWTHSETPKGNEGENQLRSRRSDSNLSQTSTLSSALSERDLSPPAALFRFPRLGLDRAAQPHYHDGEQNAQQASSPSVGLSAQLTGRRNFRARKEKQLHPYLFDKAQHQKQFRNHGMRPIRVEHGQTTTEIQDSAAGGHDNYSDQYSSDGGHQTFHFSDNETQYLAPSLSHNHVATTRNAEESESELLNLTLPRTTFEKTSSKRRKLAHPIRSGRLSPELIAGRMRTDPADECSVPPSPPSTSSTSLPRATARPTKVGFRLPRGLTPDAPPTPQISSDIGNAPSSDDAVRTIEEQRPRQISRSPSEDHARVLAITVDSSTESSEEDHNVRLDEMRLRKERRRIRGVLPASWLKIDLRAQQRQKSPSPTTLHRSPSASPQPGHPLKGVAQRISRHRTPLSGSNDPIPVSNSESEEDLPRSPAPTMRQTRIAFDRERSRDLAVGIDDDDRMELDWVDAMLPGFSRPRPLGSSRNRQPKITEKFDMQDHRNTGLMQGERAANRGLKAARKSTKSRINQSTRSRAAINRGHLLSIVDVTRVTDVVEEELPQFVRLALRRARRQHDHGRHSPSHKQIRLAAQRDTDDALSVLTHWREGTLHPIQQERSVGASDKEDFLRSSEGGRTDGERTTSDHEQREVLREVQYNRQQRLPLPIQKQEGKKRISRRFTPSSAAPRFRQTHLNPTVLRENDALEEGRPGDGDLLPSETTPKNARQRLRVQRPAIRFRTAQLESLEDDFTTANRAAVFEHRMTCLTEHIARHLPRGGSDFRLQRYLSDLDAHPDGVEASDRSVQKSGDNSNGAADLTVGEKPLPHRSRKRLARRVDVEAREFRQPHEPLPFCSGSQSHDVVEGLAAGPVLQGLKPFGSKYATDFDVLPLPLGTYFHESSFIGSGDFAGSLNFGGRNLDNPTGRIRIHIADDVLEWGAWTEDVAIGLARIPCAISDALQALTASGLHEPEKETTALVLSNVDYLLRSTIRYFTRCLAFLDPVDRRECSSSVHRLIEALHDVLDQHVTVLPPNHHVLVRCLQYCTVICRQYYGLCDHPLVPPEAKARSRDLLMRAIDRLAGHMGVSYVERLRALYEELQRAAKRDEGLRDDDADIVSVVILHSISKTLDDPRITPATTLLSNYGVDNAALSTVATFDKVWYDIFSIQPALEIDECGILRLGTRLQDQHADWAPPKQLVTRLLDLYRHTSAMANSTINEYMRATFTRCNVLINRWGWWRCESLLGVLFDFYARHGLAHLRNEDAHTSPRFLSDLNQNPALDVQPGDPSFHIFLKTIASALQGMKKNGIYTERKIGGIAWRFIPNHGRLYRKDAELRQDDLDSLRNHHDLLCTLYYASPPDHRLGANLIRNLVDHASSHREACRLNIRAWSNLVAFQASTDEPIERLAVFNEWFRDMITATIAQYRLARSEVEQQVSDASARGEPSIAVSLVDDTIARNQRQIAASLVDALVALGRALESSRNIDTTLYILDNCCFVQVLSMFDPSARRLYRTMLEALNVVMAVLDIQQRYTSKEESQQTSEDSQEFGDSLALRQFAATQAPQQDCGRSLLEILHVPLANVVSNVFGADTSTDDDLLMRLVEAWTRMASLTVRSGERSWSSYIEGYRSDTWSQLRDTDQRRKFTPYFLSRIVELADAELSETDVLAEWLRSLVEREAMLKFQASLTNSLLNHQPNEPLLENLPFTRSPSGRYEISLHDFRERRLGLISTVLSNMRNELDKMMHEQPHAFQSLRQRYAELLGQVTSAMKHSYTELQATPGTDVADVSASGRYVEFVQHVVTFLQQYTTDICVVDRFFTDSAAFPLPATDPTYVVGRLRSYAPKLRDGRRRKELAVFVQTVSERAAVDGHQGYLVDQLVSAMADTVNPSNTTTPSLQHVLCAAILPAYIEHALFTACSWIVTLPLLEACTRAAGSFLYQLRIEDDENVKALSSMLESLLHSATRPIWTALRDVESMAFLHVQKTLAVIFELARNCLTCVQHMERIDGKKSSSGFILHQIYRDGGSFRAHIASSHDDLLPFNEDNDRLAPACPWPDTRDYVARQVRDKFNNDWHASNGQCFVRRGGAFLEVVPEVDGDARTRLLESLSQFLQSYEAIFLGARSQDTDALAISDVIV